MRSRRRKSAAALRSPAVGDIDRNGDLEVVVGDFQGCCGCSSARQPAAGFPKRANPDFSYPVPTSGQAGYYAANPALVPGDYPGPGALPNSPDIVPDLVNRKDKINRTTRWFLAAPTLGDIDGDADLEIVAGNGDRHLYAFNADGSPFRAGRSSSATRQARRRGFHRPRHSPGAEDDCRPSEPQRMQPRGLHRKTTTCRTVSTRMTITTASATPAARCRRGRPEPPVVACPAHQAQTTVHTTPNAGQSDADVDVFVDACTDDLYNGAKVIVSPPLVTSTAMAPTRS